MHSVEHVKTIHMLTPCSQQKMFTNNTHVYTMFTTKDVYKQYTCLHHVHNKRCLLHGLTHMVRYSTRVLCEFFCSFLCLIWEPERKRHRKSARKRGGREMWGRDEEKWGGKGDVRWYPYMCIVQPYARSQIWHYLHVHSFKRERERATCNTLSLTKICSSWFKCSTVGVCFSFARVWTCVCL